MQLDELKKSMSTLEQVLAKTNTDININVSASETAQTKLLKKFRQGFTSCLILAIVFAAMALGNLNPHSFPLSLKIYLVVYLLFGSAWYIFMYLKLKSINIAALTPGKLFSKTANIRILMLSGEIVFGMGIVILFTLLLPNAWEFNRTGFWCVVVTLVFAIIYGIVYMYPQYIKLFRDLNSIKE